MTTTITRDALLDAINGGTATVVDALPAANCGRGEALADRLADLGYRDVRVYRDGIEDWVGAGLPVESV